MNLTRVQSGSHPPDAGIRSEIIENTHSRIGHLRGNVVKSGTIHWIENKVSAGTVSRGLQVALPERAGNIDDESVCQNLLGGSLSANEVTHVEHNWHWCAADAAHHKSKSSTNRAVRRRGGRVLIRCLTHFVVRAWPMNPFRDGAK